MFGAEIKPHLVHEAVRAEQNANRAGTMATQEPRSRLRRALEALAPEGHRPRPRRHDARRPVHRRRPRLRQGAAQLRGQGEPQGGEGRPSLGARRARRRGHARAPRRTELLRALDQARAEPDRGGRPRRAGARRRSPTRRWRPRKSFRNLERVAVVGPAELEVAAVVWARSLLVSEAALPIVEDEGALMHAGQVVLAPVVSEKSYHGCVHGTYTFRVHPDAHKTQIRQAIEELFEVHVVRVNVLKVQPKPKRRGQIKGTQAGLEEGDRPAEARRDDRGLPGSAALMPVRRFKPTSPGRRFMTVSDFAEITKSKPEKALTEKLTKKGGRNANGRITTRHQGGGHKRRYRVIDFKRTKDGVPAKVAAIEYDPNRSARIALLHYARRLQGLHPRSGRAPRRLRGAARAPAPTSSPATRCRSRTSRPARSSTTSSSSPAAVARSPARPARASSSSPRTRGYATLRLPSGEMRRVLLTCRAHGRPGRQRRPRQHHGRQGGAQPLARQAPDGPRLGDEPGRPSARRRRGQVEGWPPPGDAVGRPDARQAHPRQAQGIRQAHRPRPPPREGEALNESASELEEGALRRAAAARSASSP